MPDGQDSLIVCENLVKITKGADLEYAHVVYALGAGQVTAAGSLAGG
jgi:hypothetical protein